MAATGTRRPGRYVAGAQVRRELDRYLDAADPAKALAEVVEDNTE